MTGNEFLKVCREKKKLSIRSFASSCGIAPRMISYYEKGEKRIEAIPINKARLIFNLLDYDLESFFDEYYPYKESMNNKINEWKEQHQRVYDYALLKNRFYARLNKINERGRMDDAIFDTLWHHYVDTFDLLKGKNVLNDNEYDKYILELNYNIRNAMTTAIENTISQKIMNALFHTEYSLSDIGKMCNITQQHLSGCINGEYDIESMRVLSFLKICYVLSIDQKTLF